MVEDVVNVVSSDGISKMLKQSLPAFSSEIRLKILSTLYENKDGLTYEQLRNKINIKKSNKFAYHINRLMRTPLVLRYLDFKDKSKNRSLYRLSKYGRDLIINFYSLPNIYSENSFFNNNLFFKDYLNNFIELTKEIDILNERLKERDKRIMDLGNELKEQKEIFLGGLVKEETWESAMKVLSRQKPKTMVTSDINAPNDINLTLEGFN